MFKENLNPIDSAKPTGTYSHGKKIDLGNSYMIFVSGQIAQDATGKLVCDDIEGQTEYVFKRVEEVLKVGGCGLEDVVKAQIFLTDVNDFPKFSAIRNKYFSETLPASTLVGVNLVNEGCKLEMEVIAIKEK